MWDTAEFVLNGLAFILIGLQLPRILSGLSGTPMSDLLFYAAVISVAVIAIRVIWTFPGAYLPFLIPRVRNRERFPPWRNVMLTAWSGMYGAVLLAAALSIPATVSGGPNFRGRDLILFLAFCVILVTLLVKGLSLPVLMRALGMDGGDGTDRHEEKIARFKAIEAAEKRLIDLEDQEWVVRGQIIYMRGYYTKRRKSIETRFGVVPVDETPGRYVLAEENALADHRVRHESMRRLKLELISAERMEVVSLRNRGAISDDVMHRIEHDLDLEDLRLAEAPV